MGKKVFLIVLGFAAIFSLAGAVVRFSVQDVAVNRDAYIAHAEDDEEEEDDEYEERDDDKEESTASSTASSSKASSTTQTTTSTSVVTREVTVERRTDGDGDGIFDDKDSYPTINDNSIVGDDNRNGIVDDYERSE